MLRLSFFSRLVRCASQCKSFCRMTPKYRTWLDCLIFWPVTRKLSRLVIFLFLGLNNTISVLLALSDSLFALIQKTVNFKSLLNSTALCRSLINKIKRRGPRTDPWGTSYLIGFSADILPCTLATVFFLLGKIGTIY